jgi:hypothetical protein
MASSVFDRDTMLDLLVNVIPLAILVFFIGLFVVANPFGGNPVYTYLQFAIVGLTFVLLLILTYFSARAVATDERRIEGTIWEELPPGAVPTGAEGASEALPDDESDASEAELPPEDAESGDAAASDETTAASDPDETDDDADES